MEKLKAYPLVKTGDLDRAREAVADTYLPNLLTQVGRAPMSMTLNAFEDIDVTVGYLTYSTLTVLQMPPCEDFYHVNLTTRGFTEARREDRQTTQSSGGASGVVLLPHLASRVKWSDDAEQVILRFSRRRLEGHLAKLLGYQTGEPIRFELGLDLTTEAGHSLLATADNFAEDLDRLKNMPHLNIARRSWEDLVMTQLLFAARHNFRDELAAATGRHLGSELRLLLEYIEQHLRHDISIEDLAVVSGRSIRTVYTMFREQLDMTPREFIRQQRLHKVRDELQRPDGEATVSAAAYRWGFTHLGRFSGAYKKQFRETPSMTLSTARGRAR
ncbi:AraC family transcriptional regulator [Brevibacterium daeguense]|uniref:AraC family transcriptional regulator n=1 Tax=Brevibacterium daeguense TaxID=909936 RepID=A0ABP8EG20_9MICO|nr:AraC family transcriptional regulator [Brevibacterium daeguense]